MIIGSFDKAPEEKEPYEIDLKAVLEGERVQNAAWASSAPLDLQVGESSINGSIVRVWLSGGRTGQEYTVTAYVRTSGGRELARGFKVRVTGDTALTTPAKALVGLTDPTPEVAPTETQVAVRILTRTAIQTAFILPTLWIGGKTFKIKGLDGWRLVGISLSISSALTIGALLIEALRKK